MRSPSAALAVVLALVLPADAAVVRLKDGGSVTGTVVGATARDVRVHTSEGVVTVASDRILSIDYSEGETPPAPAAPQAPAAAAPAAPTGGYVFPPARHRLALELGMVGPVSDIDFSEIGGGSSTNGNLGLLVGVQYLYEQTPRLGLGLDLQWLGRSDDLSFSLLPNAATETGGSTFLFLGVMRYDLRGRGTARPFLLLGAGGHRTTLRVDAQPNVGFVWTDSQTFEVRRLIEGDAWGLAASARLGLELRPWDPATFSLEAGWTGLASARYGATAAGNAIGLSGIETAMHFVTFTGRWGWRF